MITILLDWDLRTFQVYQEGTRIDLGNIPGYVQEGQHQDWLQSLAEEY